MKFEKKQKTTIFNRWKPWKFLKNFVLENVVFLYLVDSTSRMKFRRKKTKR